MKNIATLRSKGTFFGIFAFLFWFSIPPTPAVAQGVQGQNGGWPTLYNARQLRFGVPRSFAFGAKGRALPASQSSLPLNLKT
jgi:hypothetical protein